MKHALTLSILLALSACADSPAETLAKAKADFAEHDFAAARVQFASYLTESPDDRQARLLQVKTLLALGDGDGALTEITKLAGNAPPAGELAELAAEAALLRGVPDVAFSVLGENTSAEAERLRALAALQKQDTKAAQGYFEAAVAAGGNGRAFADYARFHLMNGAVAEAQAMAARAEKVDPEGIDTLLVLGQLAIRGGDLAKALSIFERAGKLYPSSLAPLTGQAAVLGDLGRIDDMQKVVDRAVAMAPKNPALIFLKAKAFAARKDWDGVRATVQPLEAEFAPLDPIRALYGEALVELNLPELAIAQLTPIARAMPGNRDAVLPLARAMMMRGDAMGALALIRPLVDTPFARNDDLALGAKIAKAANDPIAAQYETRSKQPAVQAAGRDMIDADAAMRAGNWAGAVQAYDRLMASTDGTNPVVLNNLAYAHLMLGNNAKALEFADRAIKVAPEHPSILDTAGWVRFKTGQDRDGGLELLRKAARMAPGNTTIRAHLAEAERAR